MNNKLSKTYWEGYRAMKRLAYLSELRGHLESAIMDLEKKEQ